MEKASDNQLAETFPNSSQNSNSISTKEIKFFCTDQKDQTQTFSQLKHLEARLADGLRKALATYKITPLSPILCDASLEYDEEFDLKMPLLLSGQKFRTDLESFGCLAILTPLEGGAETRLLRRLRANGYQTQITSARGLGDPVLFLTQLHGIRPPHLGHQNVGRNGALGEVQQVIPQLNELLVTEKPLVLWLLEGQVLSKSELLSINNLCQQEKRIKIVIEMGGSRSIQWQPLNEFLNKD